MIKAGKPKCFVPAWLHLNWAVGTITLPQFKDMTQSPPPKDVFRRAIYKYGAFPYKAFVR